MKTVKVNGGANIADKHLITPAGAVTEVSDDDLSFLKQNKMFNRMIDRGFIKVETKETKVEKVVSDMTGRDESAPLVPDDFTEETQGAKPSKQSKKGK
jgi:PBP1b-binding outer membrane lipoprotein LpoB